MISNISPQVECQEILQCLRRCNLDFLVQESAYSAYVTIRKRYRKDAKFTFESNTSCLASENQALKTELTSLNLSLKATVLKV